MCQLGADCASAPPRSYTPEVRRTPGGCFSPFCPQIPRKPSFLEGDTLGLGPGRSTGPTRSEGAYNAAYRSNPGDLSADPGAGDRRISRDESPKTPLTRSIRSGTKGVPTPVGRRYTSSKPSSDFQSEVACLANPLNGAEVERFNGSLPGAPYSHPPVTPPASDVFDPGVGPHP